MRSSEGESAKLLGARFGRPSDSSAMHFTRSEDPSSIVTIREADLEPYVGLRYLSKLFKLMALVIVLQLFAELVTGISGDGAMSPAMLVVEASRLVVLAGMLWGAGDLASLFIDMGHDLRATRILIGRQAAHHMAEHHADRGTVREAPGTPPVADAPPVQESGSQA